MAFYYKLIYRIMKTFGILLDNHKLEKFEKELKDRNFPNFESKPHTKDITLITVQAPGFRIHDLTRLVNYAQSHFNPSKN